MRRASTKVMFVSCCSFVILADISLATLSYFQTLEDTSFLEDLGWLPLFFVMCIVAASSIGIYPVIYLLMGELFPSDIRFKHGERERERERGERERDGGERERGKDRQTDRQTDR